MVGKNLALGLTLSGAFVALAGCGGGGGGGNNGDPDPSACNFRADGTADPSDPNCYCPDNSLVPQGGDCVCDTSDPDDPDCDFCDYPANSDHPDCRDTPQADPFTPGSIFWGGLFAYDNATDNFRTWVAQSGEVPPWIEIDLWDRRYRDTQNNSFRCGLLIVPPEGITEVAATYHAYNIPEGDLRGDYTALLFSLREGNFRVLDNPDDNAQGGRIPGCIEVQDDPRRGFGEFNEGDVVGWAEGYSWSVGLSSMIARVRTEFEGLPADNAVRQLLEQGYVNGGTIRIEAEFDDADNLDLASPGQWSLGFQVDADFMPLEGEGNSVRIPISDQAFNADGARPISGLYQQNAFFGFGFGG